MQERGWTSYCNVSPSFGQRFRLLLQAADAIAELLANGILNCDLKPGHFHAQLLQSETCRCAWRHCVLRNYRPEIIWI